MLPREQRGWTRVPASCQEEEYQRQRWLERRQWQDQVQTTSPPVQLLCDWSIMRWCWSLIGQLPDSCGQSWECWVDSQSIKHCAGESTGAGGNLITMLQLKTTVSDLICQRIERLWLVTWNWRVGGEAGRGGRNGPGTPKPKPAPNGPNGNCGLASGSGSWRLKRFVVSFWIS